MVSTLRSDRRAGVIGAVALAIITTVLLGACSSGGGSSRPTDDYAGPPKGVSDPGGADLEPYASWVSSGDSIAVTLLGSSTCPQVGESMRVRSSNSLVVEVEQIPPDKICTADFSPHTTVFDTPDEVTTTSDVTIVVDGQTITLRALR